MALRAVVSLENWDDDVGGLTQTAAYLRFRPMLDDRIGVGDENIIIWENYEEIALAYGRKSFFLWHDANKKSYD